MVAFPHLPSNGRKAAESSDVAIDQVYIGSCTNGRIEDLRIAAKIFEGRTIADDIRCIVVPASTKIWKQANDEGLFDIFTAANCVVSAPTCGACLGGWMGVLAAGERCVSTTNRNFVGAHGIAGERSVSRQSRNRRGDRSHGTHHRSETLSDVSERATARRKNRGPPSREIKNDERYSTRL